jgi:hypothetical protein
MEPLSTQPLLQRYLPALEQLRFDIETRLEQHPVTSRWTPQHTEVARLLLNVTVTEWHAGRVDTAALRALRALSQALGDSTATVLRGSLDVIDTWHESLEPPSL